MTSASSASSATTSGLTATAGGGRSSGCTPRTRRRSWGSPPPCATSRRGRGQRPGRERPTSRWRRHPRGGARGMGGKLASCGEENLLNLPGARYRFENILIHEFNHAIHQHGLRRLDPTFDGRLRDAYQKAMAAGLWKGTYLTTNPGEYWAE